MKEYIQLIIGALVLLIGIPIGNFLAKITSEELNVGQVWFKLITIICGVGAVTSLILTNDILLFSFLFIGIVTSRSLRNAQNNKKS